jgi:hypothetical protein
VAEVLAFPWAGTLADGNGILPTGAQWMLPSVTITVARFAAMCP